MITWTEQEEQRDVRYAAFSALGQHAGTDEKVRAMLITRAEQDGDEDVRRLITKCWVYEFGDRRSTVLLTERFNSQNPWFDPHEPITNERVTEAAAKLDCDDESVRALYEQIACELPLRLEWKLEATVAENTDTPLASAS